MSDPFQGSVAFYSRRREFRADDAVCRHFMRRDTAASYLTKFSRRIQRSLLSRGRFPTTRLTPRQRFAQLVSNDAAKRRGPLECTYILPNLTYAHLLRAANTPRSSPPALLHFCSLFAPTCAYENTREPLTYVSVRVDTLTHIRKQEK